MNRIRQAWWTLRAECRLTLLWFICSVPAGIGIRLRALLMPWFLRELGDNTELQAGLRLTNPEKISIGANCSFAQGVFITGGGGVRIGDWVGLGPDVKIWSVNHRFADPDRPWLLQGWERKEVVIEDDVWLGAAVFVMPGVTIGRGAIISACAVVSRSIPPYAVVAGNPGRIVGWRKRAAQAAAGGEDGAPGGSESEIVRE